MPRIIFCFLRFFLAALDIALDESVLKKAELALDLLWE